MVAQFSGCIYPDLSFSCGRVPRAKKSAQDRRYDRQHEEQYDAYLEKRSIYGQTETSWVRFFSGMDKSYRFIDAPKSSQPKKLKYGKKGITSYGKRCVRSIACLLQNQFSKKLLGFGTCTIPEYPEGIVRFINGRWSEIVRRFFQEISRKFKRKGCDFLFVSTTEIQERRFRTHGVPYLHLHFVYKCREKKNANFIVHADELRRTWGRVVSSIARKSEIAFDYESVNFNASIDTQLVKKDAAGYLGKYISKGSVAVKSLMEQGFEEFPGQWWSACVQMKKVLKKSIIRVPSHVCKTIFYSIDCMYAFDLCSYFKYISVPIAGVERVTGCVVQLYNVGKNAILELMNGGSDDIAYKL
jgi:hypothetical protein